MDEMLAALETGPSRTWRWVAAGIGVAGVAAAGFLALRPPTCRDARELLAGVWDAPVRARVDSAFAAAAGGPRGKEAFDHSAALLDRYAATWASMRDESCRASSRGEQSAAMQDLRTSCLDARLGHLRALAGLFADADAQTVNRAAGAAMSLDRLEPCSDPAALAGTPALPADAAKRAAILAARNRAAQALTLYNAGRIAAAKTEATAAVADARGIGYGPVLAEALRTLGQVIIDTDLKAAQAALEEAIAVGSEAKADRVVAQAHMGLMWVVGVKQARRQEALAMQPLADAAIRRAGGGDAMRSVLLHDVGRILLNDGKFAEAEATLRESAALAEKVYGKDSNNLGRSLRQLAAVLEREEKFDEARVCAERAVDIFERAFGSNSPEYAAGVSDLGTLAWYVRDLDTAVQHTKHAIAIFEVANAGQPTSDLAGQYHNLGQMTEEQGKHAEARTYFDKALAMSEKLLGPDHPRVAQTLYSIAEVDVEEGDRKHAIETMRRALAIQDKRLPPDHPDIAYVLSGLAEVLGKEGQYDEAAQLAARALAIREKKLGPTHTEVGKALVVAAAIEIDRDRWKDALPLLERAVPILQSDAGAVARANAEFGLAEAYVKLGRDRARAIAMARDARTILEKSANTGKTLAEIDAWLAKNR
jgi:tetratricopeptide (TPR) repeat protein